jgi:ATP-dependent helicase HrpA
VIQQPVSLLKRIARIRSALPEAMIQDQWVIRRGLRSVSGKSGRSKPSGFVKKRLDELERLLEASAQRRRTRLETRPRLNYPEHLPILRKMKEIVRAVQDHPVVIVSGETGSGKSTQIPKMCLEAGRGIAGRIGCTQPRRIAATTIARRIAQEMGEDLGNSVGYKIRFSDRTGPNAYIKILTDGMLLAETQQDRFLNEYDTLIIDEAHERSLNIDFLLGILRSMLRKRRDLRVIVTSATLDTEKFSRAFDNAPVVEVTGRLFPVEVEYHPPENEQQDPEDVTYVDRAVLAVERIASRHPSGDILVFMPTEQDIRETCERVEARDFPNTTILPLFARLPGAQQNRVFASRPGRKIVVATNVAETSLTIPGIRYVVDTGLARIPRYLPSTRTTSLAVSLISRSSADQRKGRCGRVENGVCIRLYSEEDYERREEFTPPEILRSNLAEVILRMLSLHLGDVESFPFVDRPGARSIKDGFDVLTELGAITRERDRVRITPRGRLMAHLPLDPRIARMMIEARKEGCEKEVGVIAAALGIQDPRQRPAERAAQADEAHRSFRDSESDFLTLLNLWEQYHRARKTLRTQGKMRAFCKERFLSFVRMREWRDVHEQITTILEEEALEPEAGTLPAKPPDDTRYARIHRAILSGFLSNIAVQKEKAIYRATRGRDVMLFPGSTLFKKPPSWIVAAEMVRTSRVFARTAARIDPSWLEVLGGSLCRSSYHHPHWEKNRGEVRATEEVTLFGLVIVPGRSAPYGPVDPDEAHRIFVRSALVEGDIRGNFPFLHENRALVERLASLEDRIRRRDIVVSEQAMADFYAERLSGVRDTRTLKRRIREMGGDAFLRMTEEDLALYVPDPTVLQAFPDHLRIGDQAFPFTYRFDPASKEDGVTVSVPSTLTSRLPPERLDWMVPGLLEEKITALIKGLPKRYRKQLVPVSGTVRIVMDEMERTDESLITAMGRFLYRKFGVDIPASAWPAEDLPDHLRMRVAITDHKGRELRAGRDPGLLRAGAASSPAASSRAWEEAQEQWERDAITSWDFESLPKQIPVEAALVAYPALEPSEPGVRIRLFSNAGEAAETHLDGVARLLTLRLGRDLKFARKVLRLPASVSREAVYFGGQKAMESALEGALVRDLFRADVRTREAFEALAERLSPRLVTEANDLLDKAIRVLETYSGLRSKLHGLETSSKASPSVQALCASLRSDLARLVPEDFLDRYPPERLDHLPRYLRAMEIRAERGSFDPGKDRKKVEEVRVFKEELARMLAELSPNATPEKRHALEAFSWMIEELRVSIFAQELTTAVKVSPKRLKRMADEIRRMV